MAAVNSTTLSLTDNISTVANAQSNLDMVTSAIGVGRVGARHPRRRHEPARVHDLEPADHLGEPLPLQIRRSGRGLRVRSRAGSHGTRSWSRRRTRWSRRPTCSRRRLSNCCSSKGARNRGGGGASPPPHVAGERHGRENRHERAGYPSAGGAGPRGCRRETEPGSGRGGGRKGCGAGPGGDEGSPAGGAERGAGRRPGAADPVSRKSST